MQWNDPYDLSKGIKYLWLTDRDAESLGAAVQTEVVNVPSVPTSGDDDDDESNDDEVVSLPCTPSRPRPSGKWR